MSAPARTKGAETPLPPLRTDLQIETMMESGAAYPSITVCDPVRGSYFRLPWPHSGMLLLWRRAATIGGLAEAMREVYGAAIDEEEIALACKFAQTNQLTVHDANSGWQNYASAKAAQKHGLLMTLAHNYLFFRMPLVNPDRALARLAGRTQFLFRAPFWCVIALIGATGLYLATRQWGAVLDAVDRAMRFESVMLFAAAAMALKVFHEMGHALTTAHYGCRVPAMGIAVMIGAPVLYTDTSDSWRLADKCKRLRIVFAGVMAEMIIAAFAIFAWSVLPDGTARSICFSFATTSLVMTLLVNLNPLMRFDGYFALSDALDVPNLQARAFELGLWRMREALFGLGLAPPEPFSLRKQRILIAYAYATWIYRFFLYVGIAALVYTMAGKALGIVLGLFELAVFIISPLWGELKVWWKMRNDIKARPRAALTACATAGLLAAFFTPWVATIESPAVLVAAAEQEVHAPAPAVITSVGVHPGDFVRQGQILFTARAPDLEHELAKARLDAKRTTVLLARMHAHEADREQAVVLKKRLQLARETIRAHETQIARLTITAPFDGHVADLDTQLLPGTWVAPSLLLARIVGQGGAELKGLVADSDVARLKDGANGVFIADEASLPSRTVTLTSIAPASNGRLAEVALAEQYGGRVASGEEKGELRVKDGWIEVRFAAGGPAPLQTVRGIVRASADPLSPFTLAWRQVARVFVREQAF